MRNWALRLLTMPKDWTYDLRVHGTTPKRLSMEAFGELTQRFADLLGAVEHVRFKGLVRGSAAVRAEVLPTAQAEVRKNLLLLSGPRAGKLRRLDDYLKQCGWYADIRNKSGDVLIKLPGALAANDERAEEPTREVHQVSSVVGSIVRIGGKDETVPMMVKLDSGEYLDVTVRGRELARKLAPFLFADELRFTGLTTWQRGGDGEWRCTTMIIDSFEALDTAPLNELFGKLEAVPGNGWRMFDDPIAELTRLRGEDE